MEPLQGLKWNFTSCFLQIFRWTGYVLTLLGAILINLAIIGGCKYHHHYCNSHVQTCSSMQKPGGDKAVSKDDSASYKQHSMSSNAPMGKKDYATCSNKQAMCCTGVPAMCNSCQMYHHRIEFHMGLAICFLLLANVLLMISNNCRCRKCCEHRDGKCECKEEKKE